MKKTYIQPVADALTLRTEGMVATSITVDTEKEGAGQRTHEKEFESEGSPWGSSLWE